MDGEQHQPEVTYDAQPALDRIANRGVLNTACEGHQLLSKLANKWVILIIFALTQGTKRYGDLKQQIEGILPKMLIQNLWHLERLGLIKRKIYPVVPPKVEYSLTPLGKSLAEPLAILGDWAYQNINEVNEAITKYDQQPTDTEFWSEKWWFIGKSKKC